MSAQEALAKVLADAGAKILEGKVIITKRDIDLEVEAPQVNTM